MTPEERLLNLMWLQRFAAELQRVGQNHCEYHRTGGGQK